VRYSTVAAIEKFCYGLVSKSPTSLCAQHSNPSCIQVQVLMCMPPLVWRFCSVFAMLEFHIRAPKFSIYACDQVAYSVKPSAIFPQLSGCGRDRNYSSTYTWSSGSATSLIKRAARASAGDNSYCRRRGSFNGRYLSFFAKLQRCRAHRC